MTSSVPAEESKVTGLNAVAVQPGRKTERCPREQSQQMPFRDVWGTSLVAGGKTVDLGHPIEGSWFFDEFELYSVGKRLYKGNDRNKQLYSRTSPIFIVNSCKWSCPPINPIYSAFPERPFHFLAFPALFTFYHYPHLKYVLNFLFNRSLPIVLSLSQILSCPKGLYSTSHDTMKRLGSGLGQLLFHSRL